MPFRRKFFKRKFGGRRKFRRRGGITYGQIGRKVWRDVKMLKSLINTERKFFDVNNNNVTLGPTPVLTLLTQVEEGTDYNNRVGLSIKAVSLQIKLDHWLTVPSTVSTVISSITRVMVVMDLDNNPSDAPAYTDILEVGTDIDSPLNHTNGKRFKVLCDKYVPLSLYGRCASEQKLFLRLNDHIKYSNSTTGARENQIYLLLMNSQTGSSTVPTAMVSYYARMRYIDN